MNSIDLVGQIADLKDTDYKNTLAVAVLIELLIDKGIFSRQEFAQKAREIEQATLTDIIAWRRSQITSVK